MKSEVYIASLRLEGEIFKLHKRIDRETNLHHYIELQKVLYKKQVQHGQYVKVLEELEKQEQLQRIKKMETAKMKRRMA